MQEACKTTDPTTATTISSNVAVLRMLPEMSRGEARPQIAPRVGFCLEVADNAGADKKIVLATIARRYIQLGLSRPEVPGFPA